MIPLILAGLALAQTPDDPWWYTGLPLAGVSLVAPEGGLPQADLEPLLRAQQGQLADPQVLRADLVTLYRVGEFDAVEADLQPWFLQDADGALQEAVMLSYRVYPAPKVLSVQVQGNQALRSRALIAAAGIDVGSVFYEELQGHAPVARVRRAYADAGYPDAQVELDVQPLTRGEVEVWLRIDEGPPRLLRSVQFLTTGLPDDGRGERTLRRWARRSGLQEGRPYSAEALDQTRYEVRRGLARMPTFYRTFGGWVEARVSPPVVVRDAEGSEVTYTVEAGRRLYLDVAGMGWKQEAKVQEVLDIDERLRLTRGFVEEASGRLEEHLQRRGYLDAQVAVALQEDDLHPWLTLQISAHRGKSHLLRRFAGRYQLEGLRSIPPGEVRTVLDQASPEVLKRGFVTLDEVSVATEAAEAYFHFHGFTQAALSLDRVESTPFLPLTPFRFPVSEDHPLADRLPRTVRLFFRVDEGPRTLLAALQVEGASPEVDLSRLLWPQPGTPFSPQGIAALARQVTDLHREAGYLQADTRASTQHDEEGNTLVTLAVHPGTQVLLRSLTVRGTRETRAQTVRGEVDQVLTLGQPISTARLQELKSSLYDLEIFSAVSADLVGEADEGDLLLSVTERPRYVADIGVGLATDLGLRAFTRASRTNLWGRAHRIDAYGQAGLQWRDLTRPEWRAALSYTAPRFPFRGQQWVGDILVREINLERTWRMLRSGAGLTIDTDLGPHGTLQLAGRVEARQLDEVDGGAILAGEPWAALLDPTDLTLPSPWRLQDSVSARLLLDLRDDPVQPGRGGVFSLIGDLSPGALSDTQVPFVKAEGRATTWIPLRGPTLRLSGEAKRAWALGDGVIALEDRYRLGGTGTLRGFRRDAVGPRNQVDPLDLDWPDALDPAIERSLLGQRGRWVPTGGDAMAAASAELLLPFPLLGLREWDGYAAALFADAGNVWLLGDGATATSEEGRYTELFHPALRYSAGAGLRMESPLGPLQVDLALNPATLTGDPALRRLLRQDWEEPVWRAHLSLGTLW
ncbi:MAG: BamA/TamA family outer membrane protein [Deltaproteobacteria bacterium]|nr:BamA/TamA family outer membrane protein [Deltaproteobacteria bacterium]